MRFGEKGGDVGGTWYWNRYPGIACDVESYSYFPLLEEMGYFPTVKFASGFEIFAYCQKLAAKFGAPVITLIDTPGAYPGLGAEERGQSEALARNILEMSILPTACIAVVIGEGGSGGALALGVADRVLMLENSVYSVISPEGCAAILWKDASQRERAAEALKITSEDLLRLKVIDEIVKEPVGGAHVDPDTAGEALREALIRHLTELRKIRPEKLVRRRAEKYAAIGAFTES